MADNSERTLAIRLIARNDRFTSEMARSKRQLREFGGESRRAGSEFRNFSGVLMRAAGAGGALYVVGRELRNVIGASIDFESQFAGVRKTVEATAEEFRVLKRELVDVSTATGLDSGEVFGIAEAAGQLGIERQNIAAFTRQMAEMGVTTNMSAEEAATALARWANITRLPQAEIDNLSSTIVALGNNMATTEQEIIEMGLRIAAAGRQVGATDAQIAALAGGMSSLGMRAEAGGTAVSRVLKDIAKAVATDADSLRTFAALTRQTVDEFKRSFEDDAFGALLAFAGGLDEMSKAGGNALGVLDSLGMSDIRVSDALLRLSGGADDVREAVDLATDAFIENTARAKEAGERFDTTKSKINQLKEQVQALRSEMGDNYLDSLKDVITQTDDWAQSTRELNDALKGTGGLLGSVFGTINAFGKGFLGQGEDGLFGLLGGLAEYHRFSQGMATDAARGEAAKGAAIDAQRKQLQQQKGFDDELLLMQNMGGAGFGDDPGSALHRKERGEALVGEVEASIGSPGGGGDEFGRNLVVALNEWIHSLAQEPATAALVSASNERSARPRQQVTREAIEAQTKEDIKREKEMARTGEFTTKRAGFMGRQMRRLVTSGDTMPMAARQAVQSSTPSGDPQVNILNGILQAARQTAKNTGQQQTAVLA